MNEKLAKWRGKSEQEKHLIALVGALVVTAIVILVVISGYFVTIGKPKAKEEATVKETSPFVLIFSTFRETAGKIKAGSATVWNAVTPGGISSTTTN
ncbi:MAG: hypothetical protein NTY66_00665 [Candidatus Vogelbacteria bacterium]|nr:hypothetical protein [Candidatus Vogelbacteria bacterium]